MVMRRLLLSLSVVLLLTACGGPEPLVVEGEGWTATFPGEVEESTEPVPVPGLDTPVSARTTTWESRNEALSIATTPFPPEIVDLVDAATLLDGAARGQGATPVEGSPLLDGDRTFRGRDAVAYTNTQDDLTINGMAFLDGNVLFQVLHVSRDGDTDSLADLVDSLSLSS